MNITNIKSTYFEKNLQAAGCDSSYILHRKLDKIVQEVDWPSRLAFCFFWNIKSLYFTYSHSYSFVLSLAAICCHSLSYSVTRCHSLSFVVTYRTTRWGSDTNTQSFMQLVYIVWGLSKYIETKPQTTYFYLTLGIFIKQKEV